MEKIEHLRNHGLFDAKVPRYTSYPPANHFENGLGRRHQSDWLRAVPEGSEVSVYVHIPFCRRLCWFCACRTQGTKTMRPVDAYVATLLKEVLAVRHSLPKTIKMGRLHLGGGTPTILSPKTMTDLLNVIFDAFTPSEDFEFSVEIDPTEAAEDLLKTLIDFGMNRASIGVQDFAPKVQAAIGRPQTVQQTTDVVKFLRKHGLHAINFDLLYGLPFQTEASFRRTLSHVLPLAPDRLAIYGYAHVPWMSKRQVMIKAETLPDTLQRYELAVIAQDVMDKAGYSAIGIDHFANPADSLTQAMQSGQLRRNFQGYTDDQSPTLIGFGASAISHFEQGYLQNAVATSAYQERISESGFAAHKGYKMTSKDNMIAAFIEELMCRFSFPTKALQSAFPDYAATVRQTAISLMSRYPDAFRINGGGLEMVPDAFPLVRVIASFVDTFTSNEVSHAAAI